MDIKLHSISINIHNFSATVTDNPISHWYYYYYYHGEYRYLITIVIFVINIIDYYTATVVWECMAVIGINYDLEYLISFYAY